MRFLSLWKRGGSMGQMSQRQLFEAWSTNAFSFLLLLWGDRPPQMLLQLHLNICNVTYRKKNIWAHSVAATVMMMQYNLQELKRLSAVANRRFFLTPNELYFLPTAKSITSGTRHLTLNYFFQGWPLFLTYVEFFRLNEWYEMANGPWLINWAMIRNVIISYGMLTSHPGRSER